MRLQCYTFISEIGGFSTAQVRKHPPVFKSTAIMTLNPTEDHSEQIYHFAEQSLLEPWCSTEEEKLGAIAFLRELSSCESFELLKKAFEIVEVSSTRTHAFGSAFQFRCGAVAAHAARALADSENRAGVRIVCAALDQKNDDPLAREAAAYGLGGVLTNTAYQALAEGTLDSDPYVRRQAILSAGETLKKFSDRSHSKVNLLIEHLVHIAFESPITVETLQDPCRLEARRILRNHPIESVRKFINSTLLTSRDALESCLCIELLIKDTSTESFKAIGECLLQTDKAAILYDLIGRQYTGSRQPDIVAAAKKVKRQCLISVGIVSKLRPKRAERLEARLQAAEHILTPSHPPADVSQPG